MKIPSGLGVFWRDQEGGQALEWPMVTAVLVLLIVLGWTAFGSGFADLVSAIGQSGTWAAEQVDNAQLP